MKGCHGRTPGAESKLRICIIAQNAYGAICGGHSGHIGGAEHQTALLARWLAAQGHEISLLTWDEGQPDGAKIDGVTVLKMCRPGAGVPGVRFFHPRLTGLYAAMRRADADIYYHNSAEYVTGLAAHWCRRHGRKFVYSVASDVACERGLPAMPKLYERLLYRYGLRHADKIIVQTEKQRRLLRNSFGLAAVALPMPCPGPSPDEYDKASPPKPQTVAWVGRAASMKRLEWLLDIAEKMPQVTFQLAVANIKASDYGQKLHARAKTLPNVVWRGTVGRTEMPEVYRSAMCLCCTSSYEGFPNTFLEAWSHGRPVVTSFDPDGLVGRWNLGTVAQSIDEFVRVFTELFSAPETWQKKSANARRYYFENHPPEKVMPKIEHEITSTAAKLLSSMPATGTGNV